MDSFLAPLFEVIGFYHDFWNLIKNIIGGLMIILSLVDEGVKSSLTLIVRFSYEYRIPYFNIDIYRKIKMYFLN